MTRQKYYQSEAAGDEQGWNGICQTCGHNYFDNCQGTCTCLSCNAQRQGEEDQGLIFD